MSQICYIIKQLCDYVHSVGMKSAFTDALDECFRLAFTGGVLRETNGDYYSVMSVMKMYLNQAYKAYHSGSSRPLPYDRYEKFIRVCRGCGLIMRDGDMQNWQQETQDEYTKRGGAQPIAQAGGSMKELLVKLRELLETYEQLRRTDLNTDPLHTQKQRVYRSLWYLGSVDSGESRREPNYIQSGVVHESVDYV
jgi:hypothetical protein